MYSRVIIGIGFGLSILPALLLSQPRISDETQECQDCHISATPGIVKDWETSRHSRTSPAQALTREPLERRVSSENITRSLANRAVGCYECHSQNAAAHRDNFEHFGYEINVVVSPHDCRTCHAQEVEQYTQSKKALALDILRENPVYSLLVNDITRIKNVSNGTITHGKMSEHTKGQTCYACHGTEVGVDGMLTIETDFDDIQVPNLRNWPNQGVGRINPDGSFGSCTACHPRHSFSIEIARKPYTCGQCHLEPDVPAYNVYQESKHGNIFSSMNAKMDFTPVPWTVGDDIQAPTCATCHNSLLVSPEGDVIAERTHDFGSRLWVRIFGLPYSHPQPKEGDTWMIRNEDDLPLPTSFAGVPAEEYLIDSMEQNVRRNRMKNVCLSCHATSWTEKFISRIDSTNMLADQMVLSATQILQSAWDAGINDPSNPFDESLELLWVQQWLYYANSVRYAGAMSGPDYAAFKNGWFDLTENLKAMETGRDIQLPKKKGSRGKSRK